MSQYKHNRIFIIGHPGAGKALLAKTLAEKLDWKFIDADLDLEFHIGRTVKEILGKGEDEFYNCQSEILTDQLECENIVVTTDASIVCNEKLRQLLSAESALEGHVSRIIKMISSDQSIEVTNKQVQLDERDLILFHKKTHTLTRISDQQAICIKLFP